MHTHELIREHRSRARVARAKAERAHQRARDNLMTFAAGVFILAAVILGFAAGITWQDFSS